MLDGHGKQAGLWGEQKEGEQMKDGGAEVISKVHYWFSSSHFRLLLSAVPCLLVLSRALQQLGRLRWFWPYLPKESCVCPSKSKQHVSLRLSCTCIWRKPLRFFLAFFVPHLLSHVQRVWHFGPILFIWPYWASACCILYLLASRLN